ncbi:NIMA-related kinase 4-like [Planoprotostelium fungivorum]|uniref:non-specific serine/threonine protein kinase n=1 Tax=Planoprotostelium fungivorum TaxID=1890364 RepID=A0A2P6MSE0_9EUKA|nr:NIMA-related kinase 4-like [Planoprotostelium fungivorum]
MDKYETIKCVGKVLLVRNKETDEQLVMKKIPLTNASDAQKTTTFKEVSLLSRLRHPNIVQYIESFVYQEGIEEYFCILMEYCSNGDLSVRLSKNKQSGKGLSEKQIVEWFYQILLAIQYIHKKCILHRDLKTQNIFLDSKNMIKLGDFGIARTLEGTRDMASTVIGLTSTPFYMSPEIFEGKPYDYKSDQWALGCILYEMVTMRQAFDAKEMGGLMMKVIKGNAPSIPSTFSPQLAEIVRSLLNKRPDKRPNCSTIFKTPYMKKHAESSPILRSILEQLNPSPPAGSQNHQPNIQTNETNPSTPREEKKEDRVVDAKKKRIVATKNTPVKKEEEKVKKEEKVKRATPQKKIVPEMKQMDKVASGEVKSRVKRISRGDVKSPRNVDVVDSVLPAVQLKETPDSSGGNFSPRHRLQRTGGPSEEVDSSQATSDDVIVSTATEEESVEFAELNSDSEEEWGAEEVDDESEILDSFRKGSLGDRVRKITEYCTRELGSNTYERVKDMITSLDDDVDQVTQDDLNSKLLLLLGERTEFYTSAVRHLLFCEESL